LKAAELEKAIEKELLERLRQASTDNEILNYPEKNYQSVLNRAANKFKKQAEKADQIEDPDEELDEEEEDQVSEMNYEMEDELEEEDGEENEYNVEFIEVSFMMRSYYPFRSIIVSFYSN
jgi:protein MAK16